MHQNIFILNIMQKIIVKTVQYTDINVYRNGTG